MGSKSKYFEFIQITRLAVVPVARLPRNTCLASAFNTRATSRNSSMFRVIAEVSKHPFFQLNHIVVFYK